jgi:hypothetical protein
VCLFVARWLRECSHLRQPTKSLTVYPVTH